VQALSAKLHALRTRGELGRGTFWDKLVFAKIRKALGWDRMRLMVTGTSSCLSVCLP
jgi:long-subunit acyl-CoA synthetase (AMP-forming)